MIPAKMTSATAPAPTPRVRLDYLHGLRGLAALAVVLGHCAQLAQGDDAAPPWPLQLLRYASSLAVPTFIVLSGFCLALPVVRSGRLEGGAWGFLLRRTRRILPAYYGALGLSLLVALTITHTVAPGDLRLSNPNVLGPLLLLHDVWGTPHAYDVPLWSLAIEWHIYFAFPVLVALWQRVGLPLAATCASVLALLAIGPVTAVLPWVMPQFYALFTWGALAAWIAHAERGRHLRLAALMRRPLLWRLVVPLGTLVFVAAVAHRGWAGYVAQPVPFQLGAGLLVAATLVRWSGAQKRTPLACALSAAPARWVGERSYALYLLHWVPLSLVVPLIAGPTRGWPVLAHAGLLVLGAGPSALLVAAASYRLLERPFLCAPRRPSAFGLRGDGRITAPGHCNEPNAERLLTGSAARRAAVCRARGH